MPQVLEEVNELAYIQQASGLWKDTWDYHEKIGIIELPFGVENKFEVIVRATDKTGNTSDQTVIINVNDVDELPPNIKGPSGNAGDPTSTISIYENSKSIHTFSANETVTWSITDGVDKDKFLIDESTGDLSFSSVPDYENPTDSNTNNDYVVKIRATDEVNHSSDQTVTITIEDLDDSSPLIRGPSGRSGDLTSKKTILETNLSYYAAQVHTFSANENVTWSIIGGADEHMFSFYKNSGELRFYYSSSEPIENWRNNLLTNSYVVVIRATDSENNHSDQTLTISFSEVDEKVPSITGPSGSGGDATSSISINENIKKIKAFSADETVTWSLEESNDQDKFTIDESTGDLSFVNAPDYETPTDSDTNNTYIVSVKASDDSTNSSIQTLTISIDDVDEINPSLTSSLPVDDATEYIFGEDNIILNFSEAVDVEKGNITIKKSSNDSIFETIDVTSNQVTGTGTSKIVINPSLNLTSSTEYYIQIDGTAFDDASGNSYAGISDKTSLSFTIEAFSQIGEDIIGEEKGDRSGYSVSLSADGSVVAIGAPMNGDNSEDYKNSARGHVKIFKNVNNNWTQVGNDIDGKKINISSGHSVSLSGDGSIVAIGAPMYGYWDSNNEFIDESGLVRIYQNVNDSWTQIGSDIVGESETESSGDSVSLSADGSVVAIGAPGNDSNGTDSGLVRIYQNVNNAWEKIGEDIDGEAAWHNFGRSVSLSSNGSVIAIADSSLVRIYQNDDGTWEQIGSDIKGAGYGYSVSLSADGSVIAIGDRSLVRIYQNDNGTWEQIGSDIKGAGYGYSVSLSADGSVIAIGDPTNDNNGEDSGHVRIFQNINNSWIQIGSDIRGDSIGDRSGFSVNLSADGKVVSIGEGKVLSHNWESDYKVRIFETGVSNGLLINSPLGFYVGERSTISIKENSRDLYALNANKTVTWSINDGIDKDKFIINSSTGDLSFRLAPDFEDPTDNGNDNNYVVTVRATDQAENTSDHTITFTVDDVDEIPPLDHWSIWRCR